MRDPLSSGFCIEFAMIFLQCSFVEYSIILFPFSKRVPHSYAQEEYKPAIPEFCPATAKTVAEMEHEDEEDDDAHKIFYSKSSKAGKSHGGNTIGGGDGTGNGKSKSGKGSANNDSHKSGKSNANNNNNNSDKSGKVGGTTHSGKSKSGKSGSGHVSGGKSGKSGR